MSPKGQDFLRIRRVGSRPRARWWGLAVGATVAAYVIVFSESGWLRVRAEQVAVERLERENRAAELVLDEMRTRLEQLEQPASAELERVAREQYRMHAPGEEVLHLVDRGDDSASD